MLNFICNSTRQIISLAVNVLRRAQKPTISDLKRAKNMLVHLREPLKFGIHIQDTKTDFAMNLQLWIGSSHANGSGRCTIHGFVILLNDDIFNCK